MKKISCIHLLNDYSGSPLVLSSFIPGFLKAGHDVTLYTSDSSEGFLSNLPVKYQWLPYRFFKNRWMRLFAFFWCQFVLFFRILFNARQTDIIYINTLLPFSAALAGRLCGKTVIYHLHETSLQPESLKSFLKWVADLSAHKVIYVSHFLKKKEGLKKTAGTVIYNTLKKEFIKQANAFQQSPKTTTDRFTILMLCSLKDYKGVTEFLYLAQQLPQFQFELVLNASIQEISAYFQAHKIPDNLALFPRQSNVHPFYQRANLVLNLSKPERWIETFGMTILEGMQYGIPAIVPAVGGPIELIKDGFNGYCINQNELEKIANTIVHLKEQVLLYQQLSQNAQKMAKLFSIDCMQEELHDFLQIYHPISASCSASVADKTESSVHKHQH